MLSSIANIFLQILHQPVDSLSYWLSEGFIQMLSKINRRLMFENQKQTIERHTRAVQVEAKTPFARWYEPGSHPLPTDDATADMYRAASSMLTQAGYEHYEISNYAKPGHRYLSAQSAS